MSSFENREPSGQQQRSTGDSRRLSEMIDRLVAEVRAAYPDALGVLHQMRANADTTWPAWCWLPMSATHAYVTSRGGDPADIAVVHAVTAWRLDRAVLHPHPDAVIDAFKVIPPASSAPHTQWRKTPITLITQAVEHLPLWCPYIAYPPGSPDHGFFLWREHDMNTGRPELRILLNHNGTLAGLTPLILYLDRKTLGRAADDMTGTAFTGTKDATALPNEVSNTIAAMLYGTLPLVISTTNPHYTYMSSGHQLLPKATPPRHATHWQQQPMRGHR